MGEWADQLLGRGGGGEDGIRVLTQEVGENVQNPTAVVRQYGRTRRAASSKRRRYRRLVYRYYSIHKVPLRGVPRGAAQERIEKHTACDWCHTHVISYYDVTKYVCCSTCGGMHVSHSSRDPQAY